MEEIDVADDSLNAFVVFNHLLVVTATLIRRAGANTETDHLVNLQKSPIFFSRAEKITILL
jgi:hypothetical protein